MAILIIMQDHICCHSGDSSETVIIEELLKGEEFSVCCFIKYLGQNYHCLLGLLFTLITYSSVIINFKNKTSIVLRKVLCMTVVENIINCRSSDIVNLLDRHIWI